MIREYIDKNAPATRKALDLIFTNPKGVQYGMQKYFDGKNNLTDHGVNIDAIDKILEDPQTRNALASEYGIKDGVELPRILSDKLSTGFERAIGSQNIPAPLRIPARYVGNLGEWAGGAYDMAKNAIGDTIQKNQEFRKLSPEQQARFISHLNDQPEHQDIIPPVIPAIAKGVGGHIADSVKNGIMRPIGQVLHGQTPDMAPLLADRPLDTMTDIQIGKQLLKGGLSALKPVQGAMADVTGTRLSKILAATANPDFGPNVGKAEGIKKALSDRKYLDLPIKDIDQNAKLLGITTKADQAVNDLINFKANDMETNVIKNFPGVNTKYINGQDILSSVDKYVQDTYGGSPITALTDDEKSALDPLYQELGKPGRGKFGVRLTLDKAHDVKRAIYQEMKSSYDNPKWSDKVGNIYKHAANQLNQGIIVATTDPTTGISPYKMANDQMKGIYDSIDEIAGNKAKGLEKFTDIRGPQKFRSVYNDPAGRAAITNLETMLSDDQKFTKDWSDIENLQNIRKGWQNTGSDIFRLGGIGAMGFGGEHMPGHPAIGTMAGLAAGTILAHPRGLSSALSILERLSKGAKTVGSTAGAVADTATSPSKLVQYLQSGLLNR